MARKAVPLACVEMSVFLSSRAARNLTKVTISCYVNVYVNKTPSLHCSSNTILYIIYIVSLSALDRAEQGDNIVLLEHSAEMVVLFT